MWPFKKKSKVPEIQNKAQGIPQQNIDGIFADFLSADHNKVYPAKLIIEDLVKNNAPFGSEYDLEQMAITGRLLQINSPLAAEVYLKFIQEHYIGSKIEPMIAYLSINGQADKLISLLGENRINTKITRQNRDILISNLVRFCINTNNHVLALSLVESFIEEDNRVEMVYGVGMERPFAELLSNNGEDPLIAALKKSNGYNQIELLCRALEDCGTNKAMNYLTSKNFPNFTRPNSTFTSREMAGVSADRIKSRISA